MDAALETFAKKYPGAAVFSHGQRGDRVLLAVAPHQLVLKIGDVMPKGTSRTNKNAYLVHDSFLAMVAKITSALFPLTECAAFTMEKEARAWLGWD